jgi:hypothetical protein
LYERPQADRIAVVNSVNTFSPSLGRDLGDSSTHFIKMSVIGFGIVGSIKLVCVSPENNQMHVLAAI